MVFFRFHNIVFITGGIQNCKENCTIQGHKTESGNALFLKESKEKCISSIKKITFS
jgi:hypothetical protein